MDFVTRAQWGARPANGQGNALGAPKGTTVHYEGPKMGSRSHDKCAALVRSIQRFHQVTRGWSDIAYNLVVCTHGTVYEGRGSKRGNAANGSTASNLSRYSVCALVGAGDVTPAAMLDGIRDAVEYLRSEGAGAIIDCHSDHSATACPGDALRAWVRRGAPRLGPVKSTPSAPAKPASPKPAVFIKKPAPALPAFPGTTRRSSRVSGATRAFQSRLKARGWQISVDGIHGNDTDAVIRAFQREKRLTPDGIGGPATWAALWRSPITR